MVDDASVAGIDLVGAVVLSTLTDIGAIVRARWGRPGPIIRRLIGLCSHGVPVVHLADDGAEVWIVRAGGGVAS
jgi:hypothetical protein